MAIHTLRVAELFQSHKRPSAQHAVWIIQECETFLFSHCVWFVTMWSLKLDKHSQPISECSRNHTLRGSPHHQTNVLSISVCARSHHLFYWEERKPVDTLPYKLDLVKVQYLRIPTGGNKSSTPQGWVVTAGNKSSTRQGWVVTAGNKSSTRQGWVVTGHCRK